MHASFTYLLHPQCYGTALSSWLSQASWNWQARWRKPSNTRLSSWISYFSQNANVWIFFYPSSGGGVGVTLSKISSMDGIGIEFWVCSFVNPCCGATFGLGLDCRLNINRFVNCNCFVLSHDGRKIVFGNCEPFSWHKHKWLLRQEKPN